MFVEDTQHRGPSHAQRDTRTRGAPQRVLRGERRQCRNERSRKSFTAAPLAASGTAGLPGRARIAHGAAARRAARLRDEVFAESERAINGRGRRGRRAAALPRAARSNGATRIERSMAEVEAPRSRMRPGRGRGGAAGGEARRERRRRERVRQPDACDLRRARRERPSRPRGEAPFAGNTRLF